MWWFWTYVRTTTWSLRDCITKCRTKCLVLTRDEMLSSEAYAFQNINTGKDLGPFAHFRGVLQPCWSEMYGAWHLFRCECHTITEDSHWCLRVILSVSANFVSPRNFFFNPRTLVPPSGCHTFLFFSPCCSEILLRKLLGNGCSPEL